jgi:hypothetical protein
MREAVIGADGVNLHPKDFALAGTVGYFQHDPPCSKLYPDRNLKLMPQHRKVQKFERIRVEVPSDTRHPSASCDH